MELSDQIDDEGIFSRTAHEVFLLTSELYYLYKWTIFHFIDVCCIVGKGIPNEVIFYVTKFCGENAIIFHQVTGYVV